jgi:PadR family transcriptional regulator PadR
MFIGKRPPLGTFSLQRSKIFVSRDTTFTLLPAIARARLRFYRSEQSCPLSLSGSVEVNPGNKTLPAVVYTPSLDNLGKGLYFPLGHNRRNRNTMAKARTDLMQGTLELLILKTLSRNAMHGYGIAQRIHETVDDLLKVEDGSLYPALYRMEERGWIASEWGISENNRRAKFYRLTRAGRKRLDGERANWERVSQAITRILKTA